MESIQEILRQNNITPTELARLSGQSLATINETINKPVDSWTVNVLTAIANAINMPAGDLLNRLQDTSEDHYELLIDRDARTVQGVKIADPETFDIVSFVAQNNALAGWQPSASDIKMLVETANHPDPAEVERIEKIWNEDI